MKDRIWAFLIQLSGNMWNDHKGGTGRHAPWFDELPTHEPTWKTVIDFLPSQGINTVLIDVGDGIEYESHPEISVSGAWSKQKLKDELDRIRSLGMTPLPKLNFSCGHDTWLGEYSRMVSTRKYYEVCKDVITEVAELFGQPSLFHLGMDEETPGHQKHQNFCCIRQHDLWWHDIYYLFDCCEKVGVRPWIWSDAIWHRQEEFLEKMPKSVMQSNWYYGAFNKDRNGIYTSNYVEAYKRLDEAGFDQIPTGSAFYADWYCMQETMAFAKEELNMDLVKGFMSCSWYMTTKSSLYAILNDAQRFGDGKRQEFPELCKDIME
ncbi:MAG: Tat pathway signal protein [Ruminococcaceae bacterium]|nr:Tat pathway signal protein [Oscillospiraceae bacterium]